MTEPTFTPQSGGSDITAYESADLAQLNATADDAPATEKKLETVLIRTIFYGRITAWVAIAAVVLVGLYGWTRNQSQESWLMSLPMSISGTPLCNWMNHGYDAQLRKDTAFRDYLVAKGKQPYVDLLDRDHCLAPDTIAGWLELQKEYMSEELARSYESIIPKKFLGTTITSSPELEIIAENAPEHRIHHDIILQLLSSTSAKINNSTTRIVCSEIRFLYLTAEARCEITTRPPVQPRARAIEFMKELSNTKSVLVTYPNTLDMKIEEKTNLLITSFAVKMTYIPARYEADTIQKLTYDKR